MVALLLALAAGCAAPPGDRGWTGTIEELLDGRVRVTNPERGVWSAGEAWTLTPTVRIGALDGDPAYVLGNVADMDVGDGLIYVLDRQAREVRVYDSVGVHLASVGRQGDGPGEYASPNGRPWLPGDRGAAPEEE